MSSIKDFRELLEERSHKYDESIFAHGNKYKTYHSRSKCQNNQRDDLLKLKEALDSTFGLSISTVRATSMRSILQFVLLAYGDNTLLIGGIQALSLSEIKCNILIGAYRNSGITSDSYGAGNFSGAIKASGSNSHPSRRYTNNYDSIYNALDHLQLAFGRANSGGDSIHLLHILQRVHRENYYRYLLNFLSHQLLVASQSFVCGLGNGVQHVEQADEAQDGGDAHSGNCELVVGTNCTNPTSDDHVYRSQLVGNQFHLAIQLETPGTKHYLLVGHDSDIAVTVDEKIKNLTVNSLPPQDSTVPTLQENAYRDLWSNRREDNHNNKVEQAQELFPLTNRLFDQTISPPKTLDNNLFYHFLQPEDPFVSLPNVVDPPTETDLSKEDLSSDSVCSDTVEVYEGSCHSSFVVSPAADNVDSLSEVIHMWPPGMVERLLFTLTVHFANILSTYSREYYCSTLLATGCISVLLLTISILIDRLYFLHFL